MNKKIYLVCGLIFLFCIFVFNRIEIIDNKIVLTLISKEMFFNLKKHKAPKEVIRKYKENRKNNQLVQDVLETDNELLYFSGFNGTLKEIKTSGGDVIDKNYLLDYSFEIDKNYIKFCFKDKYLPLINEIEVELIQNEKSIGWAIIPVATDYDIYETIIQWKSLEENIAADDISFNVLSCRNTRALSYIDITNYVISRLEKNIP
jgi:hypothetical protein